MKTTGIALIVIGLILTIVTSFQFFTKKKVVDIGKLEITKEEPHRIAWSPIIGVVVMGIGGAVLVFGNKK